MKKKILLIALWNSIHTEKWLSHFNNQEFDFCIFPSNISKHREIKISSKSKSNFKFFKIFPNNEVNFMINKFFHYLFKDLWLIFLLKICLFIYKPNIIHTLEMQRAGLLFLKLRKKNLHLPWIATNWGSDLYLFSKLEYYRDNLIKLINSIDYYSAECERDYVLAEDLGFSGVKLPCIPNGGGFNISEIQELRNQYSFKDRNIILIKGYQSIVGRALDIVKVIENTQLKLKKLKIVFYSASDSVVINAELIKNKYKLDISTFSEKNNLNHNEIINLFSKSLIYIGHSLSDGISTSLLEAMALGAYPIQSDTSCAKEWLDKDSGFISSINDLGSIEKRIVEVISNEKLFQKAFEKNINIITSKAKKEYITHKALSFYEI